MVSWLIFIDMKLIDTISNVVTEAKEAYELACDKGVPERELDRLEKNYYESLKLLRIYENLGKRENNLLPKN
jgi:ribosome-interacting GTPase 1